MIISSLWKICLSASSTFKVTVRDWLAGQDMVRVMVKVRVKVRLRVHKYLGFDLWRHSEPFIWETYQNNASLLGHDCGPGGLQLFHLKKSLILFQKMKKNVIRLGHRNEGAIHKLKGRLKIIAHIEPSPPCPHACPNCQTPSDLQTEAFFWKIDIIASYHDLFCEFLISIVINSLVNDSKN